MEKIKTFLEDKQNVFLSDKEISDLGITLGSLDIRTGATSPSQINYFLPRTDFPEATDSPELAKSPLMDLGSWFEHPHDPSGSPRTLPFLQSMMFPDAMTYEYNFFVFDKGNVSWSEFRKGKPYYGWKADFHGDTDSLWDRMLDRRYMNFESPMTIKIETPLDSPTCHSHKGHRYSIVGLENQTKCGSTELLSSMELFVIVSITQREMLEARWKTSNKCYFTFPQLVLIMDCFGGFRIAQSSYYDDRLHIQFTEVLDLGHMLAIPKPGQRYFDMVDRKDYLEKVNLILKWAWPIAQGSTISGDFPDSISTEQRRSA